MELSPVKVLMMRDWSDVPLLTNDKLRMSIGYKTRRCALRSASCLKKAQKELIEGSNFSNIARSS